MSDEVKQEAEAPATGEEGKSTRSMSDIQEEYSTVCQQIGERSYRMALLEAEVEQLHKKAFQLNQEANLARLQEKVEAQ